MQSRTYQVGKSTIRLIFGDLTTSKAEVLVSSDDHYLSMGGGVSGAILRAGGNRIATEASKMVPAESGDVLVTSAGDLPAKYVFHVVTIGPRSSSPDSSGLQLSRGTIIRQAVQRAIRLLPLLRCKSIAFPALGTGVADIPLEEVASEMASALIGELLDCPLSLSVEFYLLDRRGVMRSEDFFPFFEAFAARTLGLETSGGKGYTLQPPAEAPGPDLAIMREAERRHHIFTMLRHLDARRNQLEATLLDALTASDRVSDTSLAQIRARLAEIEQLRRNYEVELARVPERSPSSRRNSVFVSSTSMDLQPHRQVLRSVIDRLKLRFVGMEEFSPSVQAPAELIRREVSQSEVYLGILGMRYGYVEPGSGLSMTELEYRQAVASNKAICIFLMDQNAPITAGMVETDPQSFARLLDFRQRVMKAHTCGMFTDTPDLERKAERALKDMFRQDRA